VRSNKILIVLMTAAAVVMTSDALDTERHRMVNVVIVAIMFGVAAVDLTLWMRHLRFRGRPDAAHRP
jgi:hypothetical protein